MEPAVKCTITAERWETQKNTATSDDFLNLSCVNCSLSSVSSGGILQCEGRLYDRASLSRRKRRRWRGLTLSQRGSADCRSPRIKKQQKQEIIKNNKAHLCLAPNDVWATLGLWQWKYFSWWGTSTHLLCLLCRPIGNEGKMIYSGVGGRFFRYRSQN